MTIKIGISSFTYTDNNAFVDGRKYNVTQGL
jgi:hypothetical protein